MKKSIITLLFILYSFTNIYAIERSLYFLRVEGNGDIIPVKVIRGIISSDLSDVMRLLIQGPTASETTRGVISLIPRGTEISRAELRGNTLYVNLSEEFQFNTYGAEGYRNALNQIVLTATELPNVKDVQILIGGRRLEYLGENLPIGNPISRSSLNLNNLSIANIHIENIQTENPDIIQEGIQKAKKAGSPIFILGYSTKDPNSAGGISCFVTFKNISDKRSKYVYFTIIPYNIVDDITRSTIDGKSEAILEHTGFLLPGEEFRSDWENVWYNNTIKYMKIIGIKVVFDDNSTIDIKDLSVIEQSLF
jgi:hypothetical protein